MRSRQSAHGFTLVETLVATGILITALAGIAQLFLLSAQLTRQAGASSSALRAAEDKLETLRGQDFTYDDGGNPITGAALEASPSTSLSETIDAFADWVDRDGRPLSSPDDAVWLRRWRITPLDRLVPDAIAIEVCIFGDISGARVQPDACLSTIRTRQM